MSFRILITVVAGAIGLLVEQTAVAADFDPHVFVTADLGNTSTDFKPSVADVVDDDRTSLTLGVGWAFSRHWSIQGRIHDFGRHTGFVGCPPEVFCIAIVPFATEEVAVDGWSVVVDGTWPVTERVGVFARLGFLAWDISARNPPLDASGEDPLYGVGVHFNVTDRWGVELAYENADLDIDTIQLGVRRGF